MNNNDLFELFHCSEIILQGISMPPRPMETARRELRLQNACTIAAQMIGWTGATNLRAIGELTGPLLLHEAGHLFVAVEKAIKEEGSRREKLPAVSWGGAAAMDMAINSNLPIFADEMAGRACPEGRKPAMLGLVSQQDAAAWYASLKAPPESVEADSPLNLPRVGVYKSRVLSGGTGGIYDRIHEFDAVSQAEADQMAASLSTETMVQWQGDFADEPLLLSEFVVEWGAQIDDLLGFKALRPDQTPVVYVSHSGKGRNKRIVWQVGSKTLNPFSERAGYDIYRRMGGFQPPEGFNERLRTLAASVSGPLVPAELALPAFREAIYALALELPQFLLPGDFNDLDEASLRHVGHLAAVYAAMCLREHGSKADRQVAAICESLANARFPKL